MAVSRYILKFIFGDGGSSLVFSSDLNDELLLLIVCHIVFEKILVWELRAVVVESNLIII